MKGDPLTIALDRAINNDKSTSKLHSARVKFETIKKANTINLDQFLENKIRIFKNLDSHQLENKYMTF